MVSTFAARRRLKITTDTWREPGELLPEAHTYNRLDSYLHTGQIVSTQVEESEFRAAIKRFCPDLTDRILELAGLGSARLVGPRGTPMGSVEVVPLKDDVKEPAPAKKASRRKGD